MASKYKKVADLLKTRIKYGDYAVNDIPPERRLAAEVNVSYMTARRAVQQLIDDGVLTRASNGRLAVNRDGSDQRLQLAFLSPSYWSEHADQVRLSFEKVARRTNAVLRPVNYVHWDDPIVRDTLNGFDGVFFNPLPEKIPDRLVAWLRSAERPVVVVDQDLSTAGIPSLFPFPKESMHLVLEHLESLGHRHIDCLNTQPEDHVVLDRIEQWQIWLKAHGGKGRLISHPVDIYENAREKARDVVTRMIEAGELNASAVVCVTVGAAVGALRALADHDPAKTPPVAICTIDGEGIAEYFVPSITSLVMPDLSPQIAACVEWMARGGREWIGPLAVKPHDASLFVGESTRAQASLALHS